MPETIMIDDLSSSESSFTEFLVSSAPHRSLATIYKDSECIYKIKVCRITLYKSDLQRLLPGHWLNDKIINAYLGLLARTFNNVFCLSTFAYPAMRSRPVSDVKEWFADDDLLSYEHLLVPVHSGSHWTLVAARGGVLCYYDSLGGVNAQALIAVKRLLNAMHRDKYGEDGVFVGKNMARRIPFQKNSDDCGVFLCMFSRFAVDPKASKIFKSEDISMMRRQMLHELLADQLIYSHR